MTPLLPIRCLIVVGGGDIISLLVHVEHSRPFSGHINAKGILSDGFIIHFIRLTSMKIAVANELIFSINL